jgi:Tetratricopeptide repeat
MIPLAALLIGSAVAVTILLPKFWHRNEVVSVAAPLPTVDNTPVPQNPDSATPPANPDDKAAAGSDDKDKSAAASDNAAPASDSSSSTATASDSSAAPAADGGTAVATGASYDTLYSQGVSFVAAGDSDGAVNVYLQAIKLAPKSAKAYAALGELYLYTVGNLPEALKYYHAAIARGGVVTFHVHHDRGGGNFTVATDGRLMLSNSTVAYNGGTGGDSFTIPRSAVREAKRNKLVGLLAHGQISVSAFHIRLDSGKNYNLAPGSTFTEAERDLILSIIGKG